MLSSEQVDAITAKVNAKVNLPLLGERAEAAIFKMAVRQILEFLEQNVPEDWRSLINDSSDGLSPEEVEVIADKLVRFMNAKIDIPLLGEDVEAKVFKIVVGFIIESMSKNKTLDAVLPADDIATAPSI